MPGSARISAAEAARRLGVSRETLYAYVSRGLVRSERQEGTRRRLYRAEDVDALRDRKQRRRDPARAALEALHFGSPILESGLTLISDGELYYRGWSAAGLAGSGSIEDVASLLWSGKSWLSLSDVVPTLAGDEWARLVGLCAALPPIEAFQVALAMQGAADPAACELSADSVRRTGTRILRLLAAVAVGAAPSPRPIAEVLHHGWAPQRKRARGAVEAALVLWADHELNVGTFAARCVASARANPYAVVSAGLAALQGARHGGTIEQLEALFDELRSVDRVREVLEARLRRGERIPGFGHPLYPDEDPRAALLLDGMRDLRGRPRELAIAEAVLRETASLVDRRPNADFAIVAMRRVLGMPRGSALALLGIARSVGWIAHAIEQYADPRSIRPRARYTGRAPRPVP